MGARDRGADLPRRADCHLRRGRNDAVQPASHVSRRCRPSAAVAGSRPRMAAAASGTAPPTAGTRAPAAPPGRARPRRAAPRRGGPTPPRSRPARATPALPLGPLRAAPPTAPGATPRRRSPATPRRRRKGQALRQAPPRLGYSSDSALVENGTPAEDWSRTMRSSWRLSARSGSANRLAMFVGSGRLQQRPVRGQFGDLAMQAEQRAGGQQRQPAPRHQRFGDQRVSEHEHVADGQAQAEIGRSWIERPGRRDVQRERADRDGAAHERDAGRGDVPLGSAPPGVQSAVAVTDAPPSRAPSGVVVDASGASDSDTCWLPSSFVPRPPPGARSNPTTSASQDPVQAPSCAVRRRPSRSRWVPAGVPGPRASQATSCSSREPDAGDPDAPGIVRGARARDPRGQRGERGSAGRERLRCARARARARPEQAEQSGELREQLSPTSASGRSARRDGTRRERASGWPRTRSATARAAWRDRCPG